MNVLIFTAIAALVAQSAWSANISVTDAWARATMPGQPVSGAYMHIQADADARLISASSPAVPRVEMHEMKMDGDVMRMREVGQSICRKAKPFHSSPVAFISC